MDWVNQVGGRRKGLTGLTNKMGGLLVGFGLRLDGLGWGVCIGLGF